MFFNDLSQSRRRSLKRSLSLTALSVALFAPFGADVSLSSPFLFAQENDATSATSDFAPNLITDRNLTRKLCGKDTGVFPFHLISVDIGIDGEERLTSLVL